jgi:hypothetical protein
MQLVRGNKQWDVVSQSAILLKNKRHIDTIDHATTSPLGRSEKHG